MVREGLVESVGSVVGSRSLLRRANSLGILRALIQRPQTLRELAAGSGLSRTAVDAVASDLVALGWIVPSDGAADGRLGRPAASYQLSPGLGHLLSLDIGANHIYAVVTDLARRVLGRTSVPVDEDASAADRIRAALEVSDAVLADLRLTRADLWTVAIGSPGAISADGKVLHFGGTGMPGWIGLDLRARFQEEFDVAVVVEGDVALGAHAELAAGAAEGRSDVVYILCGARTSGATIVNGRVHRGVHGAAGIVGEMSELRWTQLNELYGSSVLGSPRPSRQQIFDLARHGDPAGRAAVDEFADDLATGAAALVLAIDPELVVIGGGSAPGADVFLDRFRESLGRICPIVPDIAVSAFGSEAVAMGGIGLAAQRLDAALEVAARERDAFPGPREAVELIRAA